MASDACHYDYDVVVVGAGVSGLYAAYTLQKFHGKKVLVLEAKDRVGGRTYAKALKCAGGEDVWDLGGQWVGSTQHHLMDLLDELGLKVYSQYDTGKNILMMHTSPRIKTYSGLIPNIGPLKLLELGYMLNKIERIIASIDPDNITAHPNAMEWDSMTAHSFLNQHCRYQETKDLVETSARIVFGADLSQISFLYFLYYAKQAGTFEALLLSSKGGAQEFRVEGSMAQLCDILADKIQRHNVKCWHPVVSVSQADDASVEVTTLQGEKFRAGRAIFAIPPHLVNNISFTPSLPFDRVKLGEEMPVGHLIKFIVTYKSCFWRDKGLSGATVVTEKPCSIGPITVSFDGTTSKGKPAILGFICADHAAYWSRRSMTERKEAVLQSLAKMFGEQCLDPIHYEDKDWAQEPYNGGCPVGVMRPRGLLYYHHALTRPFGRIHWAGTECARVWCGYIEGALESAKRAVSEVVDDPPPSFGVWKESPAFTNYQSYVSDLSPSVWRRFCGSLKWMVAIGVLGLAIAFARWPAFAVGN